MLDLVSRDDMLRFQRRSLRTQGSVLIFCISFVIFDVLLIMKNPTISQGIALGAMIINCLWSLMFFLEAYSDFKNEKRRCGIINELKDREHFNETIKFYESSKENYENMIKNYMGNACEIHVSTVGEGGVG